MGNPAATSPVVSVTVNPTSGAGSGRPSGFIEGCGPGGVDRGSTWVVARCDTLVNISARTGLSIAAIRAASPAITDPDLIHPDQIIQLPGRR